MATRKMTERQKHQHAECGGIGSCVACIGLNGLKGLLFTFFMISLCTDQPQSRPTLHPHPLHPRRLFPAHTLESSTGILAMSACEGLADALEKTETGGTPDRQMRLDR